MVRSEDIREQLALRYAGAGAVYHGFSDVADKGKWIAILNFDWPPADRFVVYAFMTKQVERFRRSGIPADAYLIFEVGEYDFLTQHTILDLTDIKKRPLGEILRADMFRYCGQLKSEHLDEARRIALKSTYVSPVNRHLICGN